MKSIAYKNLPTRLPWIGTLVIGLFLDRISAPGWAWGIAGTLLAVIWVGGIVAIVKMESVDIFAEKAK